MRPSRPRWQTVALLARSSNLPTVWTNVLAGLVASGVGFGWSRFAWLAASVSLFYTGGMFLNDAFDAGFDARFRRDRPIPAGDISRSAVTLSGAALLAAGAVVLAAGRPGLEAQGWSLLLIAAILYYDWRHKRDRLGPAVMGLCRGLVYCVSAAATAGFVSADVAIAAALMTGYVLGLTWISRRLGPSAGWSVPLLLAGISLVDAGVIAAHGSLPLAGLAIAGFLLTLALQRVVSGD